jgi:hypothetical protein
MGEREGTFLYETTKLKNWWRWWGAGISAEKEKQKSMERKGSGKKHKRSSFAT